jgi:hypothetical protein
MGIHDAQSIWTSSAIFVANIVKVNKAVSVIMNPLFASYLYSYIWNILFFHIWLFFFVTNNMAKAVIKFVIEISCTFFFLYYLLKVCLKTSPFNLDTEFQ